MKVILLEDVKSLGKAGEMVNAKTGYARNFLFPNNKAVEATKENKEAWEAEKQRQKEEFEANKAEAENIKDKIEGLDLVINMKTGADGRLFGSVTAQDIADALKEKGIEVDKKKVELKENLKLTGGYTVDVRVFPEMIAKLKLSVQGL